MWFTFGCASKCTTAKDILSRVPVDHTASTRKWGKRHCSKI
jgi:hypothetical protein